MTNQRQAGTTSTGTDPAYVPDREVFDAYTHQQIWDLARERLAPAELRRVADAWGGAAEALGSAFDEHARTIARLSGEWSGIAAVAAAHAATALVRAGDDTAEFCRVLRQLMTANADAAESVRVAIPPPPQSYRPDPDSAVEAATGAQRRTAYNLAATAATATAQDAMTFGYNPTIPASGDNVPRFPAVVATAPGASEVSEVTGPSGTTVPGTEPETIAGSAPAASQTTPAGAGTAEPGGATLPGTTPGPVDGNPQSLPGTDEPPAPTAPDNAPQPLGNAGDAPPEAADPADAAGPPAESGGSETAPAPETSPAPETAPAAPADPAAPAAPAVVAAPAAETAPAAESAPNTRPAGADPMTQPSATPADRGTGTVGPANSDPAPRSPGSTSTPGAIAPTPAGPPPTGTAPAPPPGVSAGGTPPLNISTGGTPPGQSSPVGGTSGPASPPASTTPSPGAPPPPRPAPIPSSTVTGGPGTAPVYTPGAPSTPTPGSPPVSSSGAPFNSAPSTPSIPAPGAPSAPPPVVPLGGSSAPAPGAPSTPTPGSPPVSPPGAPSTSTPGTPPLSPPGTAPSPTPGALPASAPSTPPASAQSGAEEQEHPGPRPPRLIPTAAPLHSGPGGRPRPVDSERSSPDYLHAPNEELTATDPRVPPVLGEYIETERAEHDDPGGGKR